MTGISGSDVTRHWPVATPLNLEPTSTGVNNHSYVVTSAEAIYVLKSYRNVAMLERLRFEHELLLALAHADLPFAIPSPVPTRTGATSVEIARDHDIHRVALFRHIPGRAASFGSKDEAFWCGEALAVLDRVLANVALDRSVSIPETFGSLASIHEYVPDPRIAFERLPVEAGLARSLVSIVDHAEEQWEQHTSGWSSQIIHGDFYPSNTLVDMGEVAGVLDFEYSGTGYRAMDFAIGLAAFSTKSWDDGCSWPLLESFASGYLRRMPLTEEELTAMPVLLLMREASSFIHWLGRMEQGLTSLEEIRNRAHRLLALRRWLEAHGTLMVHRLGQVSAS